MYMKSMRVKDVNGNEVVVGGEEIFRAYKDLVRSEERRVGKEC